MIRIVSTLASALSELCEILESTIPAVSASRQDTIATIAQLASEFCADCIPSRHAQVLQPWAREIERTARRLD